MSEEIVQAAVTASSIGLSDIIVVATLVLGGGWYLLKRRKKKSEFDHEMISTLTMEQVRVARSQSVTESGFIGKLQNSGTNVAIFYGSQTGTAEEYATRLTKEAVRYGMKGRAIDPEECDMTKLAMLPEMIQNHLIIFTVATYGEGDPTDNMKDFFELLESGDTDFAGVKYAVFALGNKTYEHYNAAGIYVDKRLAELGATRVLEVGLGDDDANIEEDFVTWKEKLWLAVQDQYGVEQSAELVNQRQYAIRVLDSSEINEDEVFKGTISKPKIDISNQKSPFDAKNPFMARISENRNLSKGERICMHIEVDISPSNMKYEVGDHLGIYARSDKQLVAKLGKLLDADLDQIITMKSLDPDDAKKKLFPCPTSYRTAFTYYVDINQLPTTYILKELAEYTQDEADKQKLRTMATYTDEGKALYADWIVKGCRSIVHLLEDMPSVKPDPNHLLELLPRLQPRFYSISSSPKVYPGSVHVTAVLVEYNSGDNNNRTIKGVCTNYLHQKQPKEDDIVMCYVRKSQFRIPPKPETPMIMIGPGTGLAPFRGFIQERAALRKDGRTVGDTILYFGCRKQKEDFLYEDELRQYEQDGTIKLYCAFSRDQPQKVYVTHLLKQNADEVWDVIGNRAGHLYVCGDAKNMAREVKQIILEIIQDKGQKSKTEAETFFKRMESQRKYAADVWS